MRVMINLNYFLLRIFGIVNHCGSKLLMDGLLLNLGLMLPTQDITGWLFQSNKLIFRNRRRRLLIIPCSHQRLDIIRVEHSLSGCCCRRREH